MGSSGVDRIEPFGEGLDAGRGGGGGGEFWEVKFGSFGRGFGESEVVLSFWGGELICDLFKLEG